MLKCLEPSLRFVCGNVVLRYDGRRIIRLSERESGWWFVIVTDCYI